MAVYFVTGELGAGKTMYAVRKIRDYLDQGRRVATNLNLRLENMMGKESRSSVLRLPDKPLRKHLDDMGDGYDLSTEYDESKFGLLVLDECLTWLNSRAWQDKERAPVLDWFLHARKKGWDIIFLLQNAQYCDPQLRETLLSYHVSLRRMDRYKVPGLPIHLPKGTLATVYAGYGTDAIQQERELYRGGDLYDAYDTRQIFTSGLELINDEFRDMRSNYSILPAWHVYGRHLKPVETSGRSFINTITWMILRPLTLALLYPFYPNQVRHAIGANR